MAAINLSTLIHHHCSPSSSSSSSSSTLRTIPKRTPNLTFDSRFNRSAAFPLVLSRPINNNNSNTKRLRAFSIVSAFKKLANTEAIAVPEDLDELTRKFPSDSGVYAVYDKNDDLQFIGITASIATSVLYHRKSVPDLCSSVKLAVVDQSKAKALVRAWKSWMEEHYKAKEKIPPGNEPFIDTFVVKKSLKKSDLRLTPGRNAQLTVPLEDLIDRLVKKNRVVAFIKGSRNAPAGGLSQKVVGILEGAGVDYESVDVLDDEYNSGLRETLKIYSNCAIIPQIFVNGELLGGCDALTSMQENGELASLLQK